MGQDDVECYIMPIWGAHADHGTARRERRLKKRGTHRPEICVPARSVNNRVELRVQRHRVPTACNSKIRRIGFSMHDDIAQGSRVFAGGGERASNTFDRAEIGVSEGVVSLHRCIPRTVLLPWSEE